MTFAVQRISHQVKKIVIYGQENTTNGPLGNLALVITAYVEIDKEVSHASVRVLLGMMGLVLPLQSHQSVRSAISNAPGSHLLGYLLMNHVIVAQEQTFRNEVSSV